MIEAVQVDLPMPAEPSATRLALTLGVAGLISGLVLVLAYEVTQPHIEAHRRAALRRAVFQVVPGATRLQKLAVEGDGLVAAEDTDLRPAVYGAWSDEAKFLGWAVSGQGAGFQDTIRLLWGLTPDGRFVQGLQVLESRETPGLGDRIYKDAAFTAEFAKLAVEPAIQVVPSGEGSLPHHVDSITGATISSKAVVAIINAGNATWRARLPAAPPIAAPPAPPVEGAP